MSRQWARLWAAVRELPAARALRVALAVWIVYALVIATLVAVDPSGRTATKEYQRATANWWAGKTLYRSKNGYLYLPQFAVAYSPFEWLPDRVGEPLWRLVCLGSLAGALWAASRALAPGHARAVFLAATVLVLPSTFASARNGQVNMPLAALFVLIALALARGRWWPAALMLGLTIVLKPIALAPVLVCGVLFPRLRWPLLAVLAGAAVLPLAHPDPSYAFGQYGAFVHNLQQAGKPTGHTWCDFAGIFRTLGVELPAAVHLAARALAGLATLGLCWKLSRDPRKLHSSFAILLLCAVYLMLFNPRTETNSYVILGAFVAVWAAIEGVVAGRMVPAAWLTALAILLGSENYGWPVFPMTNLWAKALATCALGAWLVMRILQRPHNGAGYLPAWVSDESASTTPSLSAR